MNKRRKYSRDVLEPLVKSSLSFAEVMRKMGCSPSGGVHALVVRRVREYGLDVSHFLGARRNCGAGHKGGPEKKRWSNILVMRTRDDRETSFRLRRALLEYGKEYRCEYDGCDVKGTWLGKLLMLHVDHINGNWRDCRPENVRFLCPNCHDQTEGHNNRKGCTSITSTAEGDRRSRMAKRLREAGVPELV